MPSPNFFVVIVFLLHLDTEDLRSVGLGIAGWKESLHNYLEEKSTANQGHSVDCYMSKNQTIC